MHSLMRNPWIQTLPILALIVVFLFIEWGVIEGAVWITHFVHQQWSFTKIETLQ